MIKQRLIDPLQPLGRCFDRQRVTQLWESEARPRPVDGMLHQPSANRIPEHIAESREEMSILLNRKTFEAPLPHMSVAVVMPMVAPDVAGHPPLHEGTQCRIGGRLHDKMKVIRHEADAEKLDRVFGFCRGE